MAEKICSFHFTRYSTPMRFIGSVIEKLQRHPKRIVFPEGAEPRVLQRAQRRPIRRQTDRSFDVVARAGVV